MTFSISGTPSTRTSTGQVFLPFLISSRYTEGAYNQNLEAKQKKDKLRSALYGHVFLIGHARHRVAFPASTGLAAFLKCFSEPKEDIRVGVAGESQWHIRSISWQDFVMREKELWASLINMFLSRLCDARPAFVKHTWTNYPAHTSVQSASVPQVRCGPHSQVPRAPRSE